MPHDYRAQVGPRLGVAYSPGDGGTTVIRAGFGLFYNDLAQNGWATAFQGVNSTNVATGSCTFVVGTGTPPTYSTVGPACIPGGAFAGTGDLIAGRYRTPYAIHTTAGVQHAFNKHWTLAADYTHEEGNHGYRAYSFTGGTNLFTPLIPRSDPNYASNQAAVIPDLNLFKSDNRSSYNSLMLHLQGNVSRPL